LSIAEASALIQSGQLSSVDYTRALLDRVDTLEPQLNAFITRTSERALAQARGADEAIARGEWKGPLHGVPFALKDIYDTAGVLTSGHSRVCIDRVPQKDATTTAKLQASGAVLMGMALSQSYTLQCILLVGGMWVCELLSFIFVV
jgi:aspartyl-tRNA(Asn)/glutamyl-tRNA(Gln) amidotransferase subunit A